MVSGIAGAVPSAQAATANLHKTGTVSIGPATISFSYDFSEAPNGAVYYSRGKKVYVVNGISAPSVQLTAGGNVLAVAASSKELFVDVGRTVTAYQRSNRKKLRQWTLLSSKPPTSAGLYAVGSTVWAWTDPSTDVAVIHVDVPASELHPIPLADSSQAQVGDPVVAIGSPFSLPETTTTGIVSQTGRSIQAPNTYTIPNAIQTDAAINPGNSGGPLLDANGHVLGLNDQIETNNQTAGGEGSSSGVGFAVPSNTAKKVATTIIAGHKVEHAFVGISLPSGGDSPAKIVAIKPSTPASQAGLQTGDVVTAINGTPITTSDAFIATLDNYQPGQTVTLSVKRSGQSKQVKITLANRPAQAATGG